MVKQALANNAAAATLAHNTPQAIPADRRITQRLKEALGLLEVRVIDHIMVGCEACYSLAELGDL